MQRDFFTPAMCECVGNHPSTTRCICHGESGSKLHAYLATKERMRYQKLLSVSEVTIVEEVPGHTLCWHQSSWSYCHVSMPFLPNLVCCSLVCGDQEGRAEKLR